MNFRNNFHDINIYTTEVSDCISIFILSRPLLFAYVIKKVEIQTMQIEYVKIMIMLSPSGLSVLDLFFKPSFNVNANQKKSVCFYQIRKVAV